MAGQRQQRLSVLRFLVEGNSLLLASPENKNKNEAYAYPSLSLTRLFIVFPYICSESYYLLGH